MGGKRPRRKVIIFLVEGPSELRALAPTIEGLYDSIDPECEVFFPPMTEDGQEHWGDLTAKYGINPHTIEKCIEKLYFHDFLQKKKLYPKDITEIIHIFDMDGVYVEDSSVIEGPNPTGEDKVFYASDGMITLHQQDIIERNMRKRENIDHLLSLPKIKIASKSIPYSAYFFSSNLDHFLYDEANLIDGREKYDRADQFADKYVDNPTGFIETLRNIPGSLTDMSYEESWQFIRERCLNSLRRHSNICILFEKLAGKANKSQNT